MSNIVCNSEAIYPKVMAAKSHDLLKKKVKNLIQKIVTLKLINFETEIKPWHSLVNFLQMKLQLRRKNFSISKVQSNVLMTCILKISKFTKIILHSPLS